MKCKICGNNTFSAHQICRHDVIVDGDNSLEEDAGINDIETPYGPYTCCKCRAEYEELEEATPITFAPLFRIGTIADSPDKVMLVKAQVVKEHLRLEGRTDPNKIQGVLAEMDEKATQELINKLTLENAVESISETPTSERVTSSIDDGLVERYARTHNLPFHMYATRSTEKPEGEHESVHECPRKTVWWEHDNITDYQMCFDQTKMSQQQYKEFLFLHKVLLHIGGTETVFPDMEEDMHNILCGGTLYAGKNAKLMKGRPSQCHANACELWLANRADNDVSIATGYALSADGYWRQHSWLVHRYKTNTQRRERIIETTEKRLAYFGFEMDEGESKEFCENNL